MASSEDALERSRRELAQSLAVLAETEETASGTLAELRTQRETLNRANASATRITEDASAASRVLKWFKWPWG
jgi:hypothetical protein